MTTKHFSGRGKLLLTGEYFVIDGALALAAPTIPGQRISVSQLDPAGQQAPFLRWRSLDHTGQPWFEGEFDIDHLRPVPESIRGPVTAGTLSEILQAARRLNERFLRDGPAALVESRLEFPLDWGLGSSSTLIHTIAQWAAVNPFDLLEQTLGGSGFDIACAQANGPLTFTRVAGQPRWESAPFDPEFKDQLYLVHLGRKQRSADAVREYGALTIDNKNALIKEVSHLTRELIAARDLVTFNALIASHEAIVSRALGYEMVRDAYFRDYWGGLKSLGAWGGDFVLATSQRSAQETREYFGRKGFSTMLPYDEIVLSVAEVHPIP